MFTYQQYMMAVRWAMNAGGAYLATKGWVDNTIWMAVTGLVLSATPFVWGMIRHSKVGTILAADDLPEVAGVITRPTPEGEALARETPKPTVTVAGSPMAAQVARVI